MAVQSLKKVVINQFMHFKHVEIKEQNINQIDCRQINLDVLQSYLNAFEFLFANKELSINNIKFVGTENTEDVNDNSYVEASVKLTSGEIQILRKSFISGSFHYQIDQNEVSNEQFTKTLKNLGLFYTYTSFFMPITIERIANLSDESRAELIDELCNNDETRALYKRLEVQIEEFRQILKHRNDQIKEFTADKKAAKLNIENESKMHEIEFKLKEKNQEYTLFKIFHNQKEMESVQNELVSFVENYSHIIAEYEQNLNEFRGKTMSKEDFAAKMKESYDRFNQLNTSRLERIISKVKRENEMKILKENKSRLNKFEKSKSVEQAQAKLTEIEKFLQDLNNQKQKFIGSFDEYYKIQMNILKQHPKYIWYLACQKLQNQIETVNMSKESYLRSIKNLEESSIKIHEELKYAKNNQTRIQLEKAHLETLAQEQKIELSNFERFIRAYERLLAVNRLKFEPRIQMIVESLKKQFPNEVIGILSELFETNEPQNFPIIRNGIIELLGKKGNAIIVRDSTVLKKCTDFVLSLGSVDVTFVPMDAFEKESSKTVVPEINDGTPIENYIKAYNPLIKNIIMEYLNPMIVSNENSRELSIFEAVSKKIAITNFQSAVSLSPNGINVFSNVEKLHAENYHKGIISHLKEMRLAEVAKRIEIAEIKYKLKDLDHHIENATFSVNSLMELLDRVTQKLESFKKELIKIENFLSKDFSAHEQIYSKMKEEFQEIIAENFQSALSKFGLESIEEFLKIAIHEGNNAKNAYALLKVQDVYKKLINTFPKSTLSQKLSNRIGTLQQECDVAALIEDEIEETNAETEIAEMLVEREKLDQLNEKLFNLTISSSELHSRLNHSVSDTFLSLNNALMKCDEISGVNSDRLITILDIPENDDGAFNEDDNYILDILNKLEVDTSDLDESLRTETNIPKKMRQMELDLNSFSKALEKFPVLIEGDKEGLKEINRGIKELKAKINKTSKEYEEFIDIFKNARILRMKNFNECLKILNEEIVKFCQVSLNDVTAELKPIDEVEPYLNRLQFFWRAEGNEEVLDESKKNYVAALAFLLGILKYKNQRQINYINNTTSMSHISEFLVKFIESNETDLQCNILNLNESGKFHNAIVPMNNNFIILNHDDDLY